MPPKRKRGIAVTTWKKPRTTAEPTSDTNVVLEPVSFQEVMFQMTRLYPVLISMVQGYLYHSTVLVIGGFDSTNHLVDQWDRREQKWIPLSDLNQGRYAASVFLDPQTNERTILGGRDRMNRVERQMESWNPKTQTFTKITDSRFSNLRKALNDYSLFFETIEKEEGLLLGFGERWNTASVGTLKRYSMGSDELESLPSSTNWLICNRGHHCMEWDPLRKRLWCLLYKRHNEWRLYYFDLAQRTWCKQDEFPILDDKLYENGYVSLHLMPDRQSVLVFGGTWSTIYHFDLNTKKWSKWASKVCAATDRYACGSTLLDNQFLVWIDGCHNWHQWDLFTRNYQQIATQCPDQRLRAFSTIVVF